MEEFSATGRLCLADTIIRGRHTLTNGTRGYTGFEDLVTYLRGAGMASGDGFDNDAANGADDPTEAMWIDIKEKAEKRIRESKAEVELQEAVLKIAKTHIKPKSI